MKARLLFALLLSGLLWGCAANTPYSETVIDTSTQSKHRELPETEVPVRPKFDPGETGMTGSHF